MCAAHRYLASGRKRARGVTFRHDNSRVYLGRARDTGAVLRYIFLETRTHAKKRDFMVEETKSDVCFVRKTSC